MGLVELRTFQPLTRVALLRADGVLVGEWSRVDAANVPAFRRMVEVMALRGVDTAGRPPVWAWHGDLRLRDAALLFDPEHELAKGFAAVAFRAPEDLVVLSDYAHWCDVLIGPAADAGSVAAWEPRRRDPLSRHPDQACLPYLRAEWVTGVRRLPVSGWDDLAQEQPV